MGKIYTKTGDTGLTSLVGGIRIHKSEAILDVYGTCDELNAHIGALIAEENIPFLTEIQKNIFIMGGILATPSEKYEQFWSAVSWNMFLSEIEKEIDTIDETLPPLNCFLLPQGSRAIAQAHLCRTVCRKLERKISSLKPENEHYLSLIKITNRLSDYFFILARFLHKKTMTDEKYVRIR
jgi:cob(I)alamin adenosyltransferase